MAVNRQLLRINAASSSVASGDTGPPTFGCIQQMRWVPTVCVTGANLELGLHPIAGDTGEGWIFYSGIDNQLAAAFTKCPMQPVCDGDGLDTGAHLRSPIVFAGDRIRAKVQPGGNAAVSGKLYIWTYTG
jgi:hypothetical protein